MNVLGKHTFSEAPDLESGDKLSAIKESASNPTVTDDSNAGYYKGYVWVNTTTSVSYSCVDDSVGAAVWANLNAENKLDVQSTEITTDFTPQNDEGKLYIMNCPTTAQITINSDAVSSDGQAVWFRWKETGVTQPILIEGTTSIPLDAWASLKCRGQGATFGVLRISSGVYEVIGKTE